MKIAVVGLGYVGLPFACAIAKKNKYQLLAFDINIEKLNQIKEKDCPIDDLQCQKDLDQIDLALTSDISDLAGSDMFFVCVPTPIHSDHSPDLSYIEKAVISVCKVVSKDAIIVIESTINPGVCDEIIIPLIAENTDFVVGEDIHIAHCPERINPGDKKWNVYNIPRNIGATDAESCKKVADFYRDVLDAEINEMEDIKTCEATKIIENTFRDINIAYVNELAKSFDVMGIDLSKVIKGASNKPFAFMPHFPSCGVGGHCIPVDPYYLIDRAKKSGFNHSFLKLARSINNSMPEYTVDLLIKILNEMGRSLKDTSVGLLGLSYKANIGDLRESPALIINEILLDNYADCYIYDPFFEAMSSCDDLQQTLERSEAIIIATNHKEFEDYLTAENLKKHNIKIIIDGKNCLNKEEIIDAGMLYKGIGK